MMIRCALVLISLTIFCSPGHSQTMPPPQSAPDTVSMPWGSFLRLWNQAKETEAQRSQGYAYEKAFYAGTAAIDKKDYLIRFQVSVIVNTFGDKEKLVPFLSKQLNLESLSVDGEQSVWVEKNKFFHALIPKPGRHTIQAAFTIILDAQRWPRNVFMPLVEIPTSEVILNVPDTDTEARFAPGVVAETIRQDQGDQIRGYVPAVSGVNIRWLKRNDEKKDVPLKMGAAIHTYISLEEEGANCQSEVAFRILQGKTNFFRILLPNSVDILEVSAADNASPISQWFTQESDQGRMIHVYASYRQTEQFRVRLMYERTETRSTYQFAAPHVLPQSVERYDHLISVGSEANVEINEEHIAHAERRDVRFLPKEIRQFAKGHALFYYKPLANEFDLRFNIKSHEKAPMVTTHIERTDADSVLTAAGTLMTKAVYSIKNNQAQFFRLKLPEQAKLLSAFLKGQEVQPALDGEYLLIPITKSSEKAFPVEIAFLTHTERFGMSGSNSLCLPENDLPVGELSWRLYTPLDYQFLYFGGNVERIRYDVLTRLQWLFSNMSSDTTENLAYAGYGSGSGSQNYEYSGKGLKQRFKRYQKEDIDKSSEKAFLSNQVQVQIPITGKRYEFESYLIKGFTPEITFVYINETIHKCVAFIGGVMVFSLVLWTLGIFLERPALPPRLGKISNYLKFIGAVGGLGVILVMFSLGINDYLADSMVLALISFALWQNHQVAKRFHARITGWWSRMTEISRACLILMLIPILFSGEWAAAGVLSVLSILFHYMFFGKRFSLFFKKRKSPDMMILFIVSATLIMGSSIYLPDVWAGESADDLPDLKDANLSLSWEVVADLLRKAEQKKHARKTKPDSDYIFGTVRMTGEISERFAALRFTAPLGILSENYVSIPLFDTSVAIKRARFNGEQLALYQEYGNICFEAKKETNDLGILELDVVVPVKEKGGVNEFVVDTPLIRGGTAELTFGEEIRSVVLFGVVWQKREGQKIRAALGRSRQLRGELATFLRKKETADESSKRVKKIYSTTYTLVSLEEAVATFFSSVRYRILNDQVREFAIRLPQEVMVHEIVGDDLKEWSKQHTRDGITTYLVKVLYPVAERYDLSMQYEKDIRNSESGFSIPALDVAGVARDVGYLGIEMQAQAELFLEKMNKARLIDIRELPDIIKEDAYSPFVYAFRYGERPYDISLGIRKHKNFEMDAAIADRIQYTHVISPQGKSLSQVRMWIRNSRKQFASVVLPQGSRALSTFLDNRSVKPSVGQKGELLLPLKRQSADPFVLDVVYEDAAVPFTAAVASVQMQFPRIDIAASIVTSDIYVPQHTRFSEPVGDFEETSWVRFVPWRHDQDRGDINMEAPVAQTRQQQAPMPSPNAILNSEQGFGKAGGTLSLKIKLPKRGKKISMNTFYVPAGVSLKAKFFLCHQNLYYAGYVLAVMLFAGMGYMLPVFFHRVPVNGLILGMAGALALSYLVPFSWKEILLYLVAGAVIRSVWGWNRMRKQKVLSEI